MNNSSKDAYISTLLAGWLTESEATLKDAGIETARLDVFVLAADELNVDKSWILGHPEYELTKSSLVTLNKKIVQRAKHVPLAYLRGYSEFYGRDFYVDNNVLIPRPESESMIDLLKQIAPMYDKKTIIDIGTGSGCLGITAKLELSDVVVIATDISESALSVARRNAQNYKADVVFVSGDMLEKTSSVNASGVVIIIANLPYVPLDYPVNQAVHHEPSIAVYSGSDGLDHYRKLFTSVVYTTTEPYAIITETLPEQHKELAEIASKAGYEVGLVDGLAQCFVCKEQSIYPHRSPRK